jgi:CHAT domain-containing protein
LNKDRVDLGAVGENTAVQYLFPLDGRTEILLALPSGLEQAVVPVGRDELNAVARELRQNLENRTTYEYLREAAQLYQWLIAPIRETLKREGVKTLVFVPDGELRNVPMAVLFDKENEKFLIEQFAVANSPGLSLMDARPLAERTPGVLINALSKGVQGFAPLPYVVEEVKSLSSLYPTDSLVNDDFTVERLQSAFEQQSYSVVHVASHGQFGGTAKDTFLLTYDGRIDLDTLETLLRPTQFRKQPIELLTLSACQTAAGDDRAALGIAGLAIKAGARSTLATLWPVNDQASSDLVGQFYTALAESSGTTKAEALRAAQIGLIEDMRYQHPYYWSPFLIIGNWL